MLARLAAENDTVYFAVLSGKEQERLQVLLHWLIDTHWLSALAIG